MGSTASASWLIASWVSVAALDPDRRIEQPSELVPICQRSAEAAYAAAGIPVFQWSASHTLRVDVLHVAGRLRAGGEDVRVRCRIARGEATRDARIEIDDDRL
ncbi:hypothetical protein OK348_02100 [Flavobacterium sp. MXW15]|uniref:Uncharacterized protein n=1 Tax=Xanthomonas chitinilytica TaxID=2989819 RepID=A0ABT3JUF3_9XANT|nr:hypothetical protein [Xanthomonas sp. H13-6]MCW4453587.1 hypothetical protein [Flavobacterium sp. MXW15]MCW4472060.1 hypothetical protein [Xanthomonas sp. H13-6]